MYKESAGGKYGAILFGLESDSAGVTNQMGHKHNWKATAEAASSLGGQRVDELGADYGGRQCDLTHMTPKQIQTWMNALDRKMKEWDIQPPTPQTQDAFRRDMREIRENMLGGR